ncbi:MAG TPA: hypothetical protein VFZ97_05990 [Acidimicrobiales bacterium]
MTLAAVSDFKPTDALVALLTVESLVFAVLGIAIALVIPTDRNRDFFISKKWVLVVINGVLAVVAVGAVFAWAELFGPDFPRQFAQRVVACVLILAITLQPAVAILLSSGVWD